MTREEAIGILEEEAEYLYQDDRPYNREAFDMAIEALQFAEHFDLLKEFQSLQEVVRCKDCRHHGMRDCPVWEDYTTEDYMWCYYGERREP